MGSGILWQIVEEKCHLLKATHFCFEYDLYCVRYNYKQINATILIQYNQNATIILLSISNICIGL